MKKFFPLIIACVVSSISSFAQYKDAKSYQQMIAKSKANHATIKSMEGSTGDCEGAIVLCGGIYTEETAPPGTGNIFEFTGGCNQGNETMSLWYTFTAQEAGTISFVLDPADDLDDYDWGLFDITNGGCAGIVAMDGSSPEVGCNSYGSFASNGPTGISTLNGGTGTSNGPGDLNGPAFNEDLQVQPGQTFALVVMNWSNSQNGYTIDFTQSTAAIYDNSVPEVVSVVPECGNKDFTVIFSEALVNSTVQVEDFTITTPGGNIISFASVSASTVGAANETEFNLSLENGLTEPGVYTVSITNVSGNVEDVCGNFAVDTSFQVTITAPVTFEYSVTNACNGINGTVEANYISGGNNPVTFELNGVLLDDNSGLGLDSGLYVLKVIDGLGCEIEQEVNIPNHDIELTIPELQDSLSCANPEIKINGVEITPTQTVQYNWIAATSSGTDTLFSQIQNPTTTLPGQYTLYVVEPVSGCRDTAQVEIQESELAGIDLKTLQFPNVLSANGDGINDFWRPFLSAKPDFDVTEIFENYTLTVYNRWRQVVFDSEKENSKYWITTPETLAGVYFYSVTYKSTCGTVVDANHQGTILVVN
jgi:hypothetical protein